jgi:hypothetical protein
MDGEDLTVGVAAKCAAYTIFSLLAGDPSALRSDAERRKRKAGYAGASARFIADRCIIGGVAVDKVSAYPCLRIGGVPEVLEAAARKVFKERVVIVPGDRKAPAANCRHGDTGRTFQKGAAIDERLGRTHRFWHTKWVENPRSGRIEVRPNPRKE